MKKKMMLATVLSLALSAFAQNDGYAEYNGAVVVRMLTAFRETKFN